MSSFDDIGIHSSRDLGAALRAARRRQRLTQGELAEAAGISRQHLIAIEQGKTTERLEELFALSELLGLELVLHQRQPGRGRP